MGFMGIFVSTLFLTSVSIAHRYIISIFYKSRIRCQEKYNGARHIHHTFVLQKTPQHYIFISNTLIEKGLRV